MSRRRIFENVARLLEVLEEGPCNKTNLTSKACLHPHSSGTYIDLLLRLDLMSKGGYNYFMITTRGRSFLVGYKKLKVQQ